MVNFFWDNIFKRSAREKNIAILLKENLLFQSLNARELAFVEKLVHIRTYRPGETVFRQGEVGVGMYIIVSGFVDIYVERLMPGESQSSRQFVTKLEPGDFMGEIALVEDNGRRTATALANGELTLIGFFKPDLNEIITRSPMSGIKILSQLAIVLGRRLKETADKVSQLKNEMRKIDTNART